MSFVLHFAGAIYTISKYISCSVFKIHYCLFSLTEYEEPHTLVVLAEEEMVVIDLQSENWPTFRQPYMASMHSSAITCSSHVSNIPEQLWTKISDAGETQSSGFSSRTWPVNGGKSLGENINNRDLLLTG